MNYADRAADLRRWAEYEETQPYHSRWGVESARVAADQLDAAAVRESALVEALTEAVELLDGWRIYGPKPDRVRAAKP